MGYQAFDQYASEYDAWFMENTNVLETELRLVASCLKDSGKILSIGCGSALFEKLLADRYDIRIEHGIEPAEGMAAIARKRGFDVEINTAEEADYGENLYDTVLFNGCPCYMQDLGLALKKAHCALREGGKVVVIDVPKESPYGLIYNLALAVGTWDHPLLEGCDRTREAGFMAYYQGKVRHHGGQRIRKTGIQPDIDIGSALFVHHCRRPDRGL
mgnify:CR=1 FL=1